MNQMKKILSLTILAALFIAGCAQRQDAIETMEAFMANTTSRWESGATVLKSDEATDYTFVLDTGGMLFSSAKYKIGRIWANGANYEIIEFNGVPAVGKPAAATIRKPSGVTNLNSLEIVKIQSGKLWIVFKESANSQERRVVQ